MKKTNHKSIFFLFCFISQQPSAQAMERLLCKSPNQILQENLMNVHIEPQIPISLKKQATMISYPRYIYGEMIEPIIQSNPQDKLYECPLCNRSFTHKKLMLHIKATNIKPLYNIPLNGCNNDDIDDKYFLNWINH